MAKIMRITTVPVSLLVLLRNQLKYMSGFFEIVAVSSGGKQLNQVAKEAGVKTVAVNMTRKITPFKDLASLIQLINLIRTEKPAIVHTHTPKAGLLGMLAAKIAGVPIRLHTVAGLPLLEKKGLLRVLLNLMEKLTSACATGVYPNSMRMKEIMIENKLCRKDKLKVIGKGSSNGIDTTYFDPQLFSKEFVNDFRLKMNIELSDFVYCFIGRMVKDKGITEIITAFLKVNETFPHSKLILVGPFENELDPLDKNIEQQIFNHPSITWIDYTEDVRPYLAIADVFVFPSYREGFPNVVMQAGAMGIPCIVSDVNGCNEIIKPGKNGIIIKPKDSVELFNMMKLLIEDNNLLKQLASQSRELIKSNYENSYVMNELLKEYKHQIQQSLQQGIAIPQVL